MASDLGIYLYFGCQIIVFLILGLCTTLGIKSSKNKSILKANQFSLPDEIISLKSYDISTITPGLLTYAETMEQLKTWNEEAPSLTELSYYRIRIVNNDDNDMSIADTINLFDFQTGSNGAGKMIDTNKTALTGKAGIKVSVNGTLYGYIPIVTGS